MRTNLLLVTLIAGGALTLWVGVSAAPTAHYVASHADCGMATPCYAALQAAIDVAQLGDEIRVT